MIRASERGVSLLNVLVVLAAGAGLVQAMLAGQERAVDRLAGAQDAAQVRALAEGGVTSMAVALRRDLSDAPEQDHLGEPWAQAAQEAITLEFGTYEIAAEDLRAKFDLNSLGPAKLAELRVFGALLTQLELPQSLALEIARVVAGQEPLSTPRDLERRGIAPADLARLAPFATALPTRHGINLNTADEPVLAALFANPAAARSLVARRRGRGALDRSDLAALGLVLPPLAGFTTDAVHVTATAEVGAARVQLTRIVLRDAETGEVRVIAGD